MSFSVPDWREAANYPSDITITQWAWEFLRRNPEYQADFKKCNYGQSFNITDMEMEIIKKWKITSLHNPDDNNPSLFEVSLPPNRLVFEKGVLQQIKIRNLFTSCIQLNDMNINITGGDHGYEDFHDLEVGEVILKFDLSLPLLTQLERAKGLR